MTARRLQRWPFQDQNNSLRVYPMFWTLLEDYRKSTILTTAPFDNFCLFSLLPNTHYCGLYIFDKRIKLNIIVTLSHL